MEVGGIVQEEETIAILKRGLEEVRQAGWGIRSAHWVGNQSFHLDRQREG